MKVTLTARWSSAVKFETELSAEWSERGTRACRGEAIRQALAQNVNLRGSNLRDSDLSGFNLRGSDLSDSDLSGSNLRDSDLSGFNLRGSDLSDSDLSGSNLRDSDLSGFNLRGSDLSDSDLSGSDLSNSNLSGSNLRDSDLSGSDLSGSDLSNSNLSGSDLRGSNLRGSNLRGSNLRSFKADFWAVLLQNKPEVPGLISAIKEGRINGSAYSGECACLVGTIANIRGVNVDLLEKDSSRPAEQWFLMIREGDKPGDPTGGGNAAQKALEWAEEFCGYAGIATDKATGPQQ